MFEGPHIPVNSTKGVSLPQERLPLHRPMTASLNKVRHTCAGTGTGVSAATGASCGVTPGGMVVGTCATPPDSLASSIAVCAASTIVSTRTRVLKSHTLWSEQVTNSCYSAGAFNVRFIYLPVCSHRAPSGARRRPGLDVASPVDALAHSLVELHRGRRGRCP